MRASSGTIGPTGHVVAAVATVAVVLTLPQVANDYQVYLATLGAMYLIAVIGLNVLVGYAGLISVGTAAFMMVGAYTTAIGIERGWWGFLGGSLVAVVLTGVLGVVTGFPALRLGPFALAVVTLAYGEVAVALVLFGDELTGGGAGLPVERLQWSDASLWYLLAAVAAGVWLLHRNVMVSRVGRSLRSVRLGPEVAQALGVRPSALRLGAFVTSTALAGLAGSLYPAIDGYTTTTLFTVELSALLLLMVILGGGGTVTGPVIGAVALTAIPLVIERSFAEGGNVTELTYGAVLLAAVLFFRRGIAGTVRQALARRHRSNDELATAPAAPPAAPLAIHTAIDGGIERRPGELVATDLCRSIGALTILDGVSLAVQPGRLHGLIGPNGSGKTTLLNCLSGFAPLQGGRVELDGVPVPTAASARARLGIGRTFQQPKLLLDETALENVLAGFACHDRVSLASYALRSPGARAAQRQQQERASDLLAAVGLATAARRSAGELAPGQQRLLEIARALALEPSVLLLDEPAAGLTEPEIEQLQQLILALPPLGVSVLLVEHHADLVLSCCDEITVLSAGRVLANGTPAEVRNDPAVIRTYLGAQHAGSKLDDSQRPAPGGATR